MDKPRGLIDDETFNLAIRLNKAMSDTNTEILAHARKLLSMCREMESGARLVHEGMTTEKIREAFAACRKHIPNQDAEPIRYGSSSQHLTFMCEEGARYAEHRREKAMRWLGFVQGALWVEGTDLDTLKSMNRPDKEETMSELDDIQQMGDLIAAARKLGPMTDEQRREQAASFAFGQIALTAEWHDKTAVELNVLRQTCRRMAGCADTKKPCNRTICEECEMPMIMHPASGKCIPK